MYCLELFAIYTRGCKPITSFSCVVTTNYLVPHYRFVSNIITKYEYKTEHFQIHFNFVRQYSSSFKNTLFDLYAKIRSSGGKKTSIEINHNYILRAGIFMLSFFVCALCVCVCPDLFILWCDEGFSKRHTQWEESTFETPQMPLSPYKCGLFILFHHPTLTLIIPSDKVLSEYSSDNP